MRRAQIYLLATIAVLLILIAAVLIYDAQKSGLIKSGPVFPVVAGMVTPAPAASAPQGVTTEQQCVSVSRGLPAGSEISGALLVNNLKEYVSRLYDLDKQEYYASPVPFQYARSYNQKVFTSPNGQWAAYLVISLDDTGYQEKTRILHVKNVLGQEQDLSYWLVDWQYVIGWIDDQQIALSTPGDAPGSVTVLNPFTGKRQRRANQAPAAVQASPASLPETAFFNKALTYAVYPTSGCGNDCANGAWMLVDPLSHKQVWSGQASYGAFPKWSPDGKAIAIYGDLVYDTSHKSLSGRMQVVDTQGRIRIVSEAAGLPDDLRNTFAWSPDSQTILAWVGAEPGGADGGRLAFIDVDQQHVTDVCLQTERSWHGSQAPVWSPDGKFAAVAVYEKETDETETVIVDVAQKQAYVLDENIIPLGWMVKPDAPADQ